MRELGAGISWFKVQQNPPLGCQDMGHALDSHHHLPTHFCAYYLVVVDVYGPRPLGVRRNYDVAGKTSYLGKKFSYLSIFCLKGGWVKQTGICTSVVALCYLFWFWQEIVFGVTYVLRVQYSCAVVSVFCLWREIVLKMQTRFDFLWTVFYKNSQ